MWEVSNHVMVHWLASPYFVSLPIAAAVAVAAAFAVDVVDAVVADFADVVHRLDEYLDEKLLV